MVDVERALEELGKATSRADLFHTAQHIISQYSIYDLQRVYCHVLRELRYVPEPYRSSVLPKTLELLFGTYQRACSHRSPPEPELPVDEMRIGSFVSEARVAIEDSKDREEALLHYVLSGYRLFVEGLPGHPEGMPFPGGLKVRRTNGVYYCPVRDKEDDVVGALCKYCGAKQM